MKVGSRKYQVLAMDIDTRYPGSVDGIDYDTQRRYGGGEDKDDFSKHKLWLKQFRRKYLPATERQLDDNTRSIVESDLQTKAIDDSDDKITRLEQAQQFAALLDPKYDGVVTLDLEEYHPKKLETDLEGMIEELKELMHPNVLGWTLKAVIDDAFADLTP